MADNHQSVLDDKSNAGKHVYRSLCFDYNTYIIEHLWRAVSKISSSLCN